MTEPAAAPTRTEPVLDSTTRADQSTELATTTLLRAAIGPVSTDYYLPLFTRFDAQDRVGLRWNTAAALTTLNWMVFRRLWNAALAYAGIALTVALLVFGIGKLAFHYTPQVQWSLAGLYALLLVGVPGFLGNALLFRHYRSEMARALAANHSIAEAATMLAAQAPQRQRLLVLGVLNAVVGAAVAALAVWASGFNGIPATLELPTAADAPATAASGNLAVGRAQDPASAPTEPASAPTGTASAPASGASAPTAPASSPAAAAAAPVPAGAASSAMASSPTALASAPAATASAPTAALLPTAPKALASGPDKKAEPPQPKPAVADKASTPAPNPAKPQARADANAREKTEAARLAPLAAAQGAERKSAPATGATAPSSAATPKIPRRAPASETAGADQPGVPLGSYGINVGVFADDNNARNAFVKLADAGLPAYTQALKGKKGPLTRVRVGPYTSAAEAERTAEKIRGLGLDALVFQQGEGR